MDFVAKADRQLTGARLLALAFERVAEQRAPECGL